MAKYNCKIYWKGAPEAYDVEYSSAEEVAHYLSGIAIQYSDTPTLCVKITNADTGRLCYDSWLTEPTAIGLKQFLESYENE